MQRGEIWVTSFNPARGHEVGKSRPSLIILNDQLLKHSDTLFALPLTARAPKNTTLLRYPLSARGHLRQASFVMIDHGRALDREKFSAGPLAHLTSDEMDSVEQRLLMVLGID